MVMLIRSINFSILVMAAMHLAFGVIVDAESELERLWFIGTGIAILLVGIQNFGFIDRATKENVVGRGWIPSNVVVLLFVAYATLVSPEPQNIVLFSLLLGNAISAGIVIERGLRNESLEWCCSRRATT